MISRKEALFATKKVMNNVEDNFFVALKHILEREVKISEVRGRVCRIFFIVNNKVSILTVFTFTLFNQCLVFYVFVTSFAIKPRPGTKIKSKFQRGMYLTQPNIHKYHT